MPEDLVTETLEESEALDLLANHSMDLLSVHDFEGNYLYASPSASRVIGYAPVSLLGRNAYEFFHPEDLAIIQESHSASVSREDGNLVVYRLNCGDGKYRWMETTSRTLDVDGKARILTVTRRAVATPDMKPLMMTIRGDVRR